MENLTLINNSELDLVIDNFCQLLSSKKPSSDELRNTVNDALVFWENNKTISIGKHLLLFLINKDIKEKYIAFADNYSSIKFSSLNSSIKNFLESNKSNKKCYGNCVINKSVNLFCPEHGIQS